MFKNHLITLVVLLKNLICPCHLDKKNSDFKVDHSTYKAQRIGKFPKQINESSGLVTANIDGTFWTHNDGPGNPKLFEIDQQGNLLSTKVFDKVNTTDLEEITRDDAGNIYLGDFGNNDNTRKNLRIFKVNVQSNRVDTISFYYPDQIDFPPVKEKKNFDCEAFFCFKQQLYLFSKNRGNKTVRIYRLSNKPGQYVAEIVQDIYINSMLTGAALSPDKRTFALISYGKIYFFKILEDGKLFTQPYLCKRFSRGGQSEAITYINDNDLLISNEGRKLFILKKHTSQYKTK